MTAPDRERLMAYLDGELDPPERAAVERELEASEEARQLLAELSALDALARSQPLEPPDGYFDALPGRIRGRLEAGERRRRTLPTWAWAAAAAVAVAALAPLTLGRLQRAPAPAEAPLAALADAEDVGDREVAAAAPPEAGTEASPQGPSDPRAMPTPVATPGREPRRSDRDRSAAPQRARRAQPEARTEAEPAPGFSAAPRPAERAAAPPESAEEDSTRPRPPAAPPPPAPPLPEASVASVPNEGHGAGEARAAGEIEAAPPGERPAVAFAKGRAADVAVGADAERFTRLAARRPRTAEEARALREEWRGFVLLYPESALADEARVRVVEAGLEAWRLGDDEADREITRRDAGAYLARDDAAQTGRVEALVAALERAR